MMMPQYIFNYICGQNIAGKFTKLSEIGIPFKCSEFSSTTAKIWILGERLETYHQSQDFQGFSRNFLIS